MLLFYLLPNRINRLNHLWIRFLHSPLHSSLKAELPLLDFTELLEVTRVQSDLITLEVTNRFHAEQYS